LVATLRRSMKITRSLALAAATVLASTGLAMTAGTASADTAIDCYEAGFDHSPSASVVLTPPKVTVDDGDPYVRQSGSC
jgi:hypothetical protein